MKEYRCANCGSKAVYKVTLATFGVVLLLGAIITPIIPFAIFLAPYMIVIGFALILLSFVIKIRIGVCRTCNYQWFMKKDE